MPDRAVGRSATIYADLPGLEDEPVFVRVVDAGNVVQVENEPAVAYGDGRYSFTLDASQVARSGVWETTWLGPNGDPTVEQEFTVGPVSGAVATKYDLRILTARRLSEVNEEVVSQAMDGTLSSDTLLGGTDNYVGGWVLLGEGEVEAGRPRRIRGFNGTALVLSSPFVNIPRRGTSFSIYRDPPTEIDKALKSAITDLSSSIKIPVRTGNISFETDGGGNFIIPVPNGFEYVNEIWHDNDEVDWDSWRLIPNRKILVDAGAVLTSPVDIFGLRHAGYPVWDDSIIDHDVTAVVARASAYLHSTRAKGVATDPNEHLRRHLAALQEYEDNVRRTVGRIPANARRVIQ